MSSPGALERAAVVTRPARCEVSRSVCSGSIGSATPVRGTGQRSTKGTRSPAPTKTTRRSRRSLPRASIRVRRSDACPARRSRRSVPVEPPSPTERWTVIEAQSELHAHVGRDRTGPNDAERVPGVVRARHEVDQPHHTRRRSRTSVSKIERAAPVPASDRRCSPSGADRPVAVVGVAEQRRETRRRSRSAARRANRPHRRGRLARRCESPMIP